MTASRKVFVVDDDPVVRKSFDRILSRGLRSHHRQERGRSVAPSSSSSKAAPPIPWRRRRGGSGGFAGRRRSALDRSSAHKRARRTSSCSSPRLIRWPHRPLPVHRLGGDCGAFYRLGLPRLLPVIRFAMLSWIGGRAAVAAGARRCAVIELACAGPMGPRPAAEPLYDEERVDGIQHPISSDSGDDVLGSARPDERFGYCSSPRRSG